MKTVIVQAGDPLLRQKAIPVAKKDISSRKIQTLIARMKRTLAREEHGVALAAPQIGKSVRLFIVAGKVLGEGHGDRVYINPEIIRASRKKKEAAEGCLSVRNKYGKVLRHEKATLTALNEKGKSLVHHASGLLAQIFQHEIDHLEGILYTDKAVSVEDEKTRE